jgi:hypothetical protein
MRLLRTLIGPSIVFLIAAWLIVLISSSWIDYHHMQPELEKQYIARQLKVLKELTGEYPCGWYYGRLSPRSKALVHEVYKEHGIPLLWESDSYNDDLPYWTDVPAESGTEKPEGMLMVPYT